MEQRHPADSRLAVQWVERFEAYYRIWTPAYALGANLEAAIKTRRDEPADHLPWDPNSAEPYDPEDQADGYGRYALYAYAQFQLEVKKFMTRHGGLATVRCRCRAAGRRRRLPHRLAQPDERRRRLLAQALPGRLTARRATALRPDAQGHEHRQRHAARMAGVRRQLRLPRPRTRRTGLSGPRHHPGLPGVLRPDRGGLGQDRRLVPAGIDAEARGDGGGAV